MQADLVDELVRRGLIDKRQAESVRARHDEAGGAVDTAVLELGFVDETSLCAALAALEHGVPATLSAFCAPPDAAALSAFPAQWAQKYRMAPVALDPTARTLTLLMTPPISHDLIQRLGLLLELKLICMVATEARVVERLGRLYATPIADRIRHVLAGDRLSNAPAVSISTSKGSGPGAAATFSRALSRLERAEDRDAIIDEALLYARTDFDFAAMFVLQDGRLVGRRAMGAGQDRIRDISIAPDDRSLLWTTSQGRTHFFGALLDDDFARLGALGRERPAVVALVPLRVRNRAVGLMYAESTRRPVPASVAADLAMFHSYVENALENLMLRAKTASGRPAPSTGSLASTRPTPSIPADPNQEDSRPTDPPAIAIALADRAPPKAAEEARAAVAFEDSAGPSGVEELPPLPDLQEGESRIPDPVPDRPSERPPVPRIVTQDLERIFEHTPKDDGLDLHVEEPIDFIPTRSTLKNVVFEEASGTQPEKSNGGAPAMPAQGSVQEVAAVEPTTQDVPFLPHVDEPALAGQETRTAHAHDDIHELAPEWAEGEAMVPTSPPTLDRDAWRSLPEGVTPVDFDPLRADKATTPWIDVVKTPAPIVESADDVPTQPTAVPSDRSGSALAPTPPQATDAETGKEALERAITSPDRPIPVLPPEPPGLRLLCEQVDSPFSDVRANAKRMLLGMGSAILPAIMRRFPGRVTVDPFAALEKCPPFSECGEVLSLVYVFRGEAVSLIVERLDDPLPLVRFFALYFFTTVDAREDMIPKFIRRLHDEETRIASLATEVLSTLQGRPAFEQVLTHLRSRLQSPSLNARRQAIRLLGQFKDGSSVPHLIGLLDGKERGIAEAAEQTLVEVTRQRFGAHAKKWLGWWENHKNAPRRFWLLEALDSNDVQTRKSAADELRTLSGIDASFDENAPKRQRDEARRVWENWALQVTTSKTALA